MHVTTVSTINRYSFKKSSRISCKNFIRYLCKAHIYLCNSSGADGDPVAMKEAEGFSLISLIHVYIDNLLYSLDSKPGGLLSKGGFHRRTSPLEMH